MLSSPPLRDPRAIHVEDRPQLLANPIIDGRTAQILSLRVGQKLEAGHICKTKDAGKLKAASDKLKKLKKEGHEKFTNDE